MRAAFYRQQGAARDVLVVEEVPDPEPGPGEVRVKLATSGVNPSDVKTRAGISRAMAFPMQIPHSDGAGIVDKVGAGVPAGRVGERVWTFNAAYGRPNGTAADYVVLPAGKAVPLPAGTDFAAGACLGIPAMTAHRGVTLFGPVEGLDVLVQAGAGAVGHYAVQIAKAKGARVIATVSSEEKAAHAKAAGADATINYRTGNVAEEVKRLTGGKGVDRIVEVAFSTNAPTYNDILAKRGRVAVYGTFTWQASFPIGTFIAREPAFEFYLVYELDPAPLAAAIADLDAMMKAGTLIHSVTQRFPLEDIVAAHEAVESGKVMGNVVVDIARLE